MAQATAKEAAFGNEELGYPTEHVANHAFDSHSYFSTIEEESNAPSPNDVAIAWRPDFNLDVRDTISLYSLVLIFLSFVGFCLVSV